MLRKSLTAPSGEWYADAVAWAKETGVVKGITDKTFEPDGLITREQLATMLFRFSSTAPVSVPERADLDPFADDEKVSDWATEPLEWAVEAGLLKGTDGNRLDPAGNATREQFAAIIERYDGSFRLTYNQPVLISHHTEKEYPLVTDADFYVSTAGDDSADGSFDRPFRTWERARDAVRTLDRTGRDGITVAFMAGNYGPVSISLTESDSGTPECPITYCKYGDGDVVFDNGATLTADDFKPISEGERALFSDRNADKIKKIDLNDYFTEVPDFSEFMMFSEKTTMTAARFPNRYDDGSDNLIASSETYDQRSLLITMGILSRRIATYTDEAIAGIRVYGYIVSGYRKDTFRAESFDSVMTNSEDGGVTRTWGNMDGNCVIRYNYYNTISASSGVGRLAQYSDDGDCGTDIRSNLLYYGGDIVFAGAGRDNLFRDNAVVGNGRIIVQSMTEGIKEVGDEARYSWPIYVHLSRWDRILE